MQSHLKNLFKSLTDGYSLCLAFLYSMCGISYIQMFKKRLVDMDCKTFQSCIPGIHLGSGEINLIPLHSMDLSHGAPHNGFYWLSFYRFSSRLRTYAQDKPLWSKVWWSNHEVWPHARFHHIIIDFVSSCPAVSGCPQLLEIGQDSSAVQTRSNLLPSVYLPLRQVISLNDSVR